MKTTAPNWNIRDYLLCFLLFALLGIPLLHHLEDRRHPQPIYNMSERYNADLEIKPSGFTKIRIKTVERGAVGISIPIEIPSPDLRVYGEVSVKGEVIATAETIGGENLVFRWEKALGGNIRVTVAIDADFTPPELGPRLYNSEPYFPPRTEVLVSGLRYDLPPEEELWPLFHFRYEQKDPWLPWVFGGLAIATFFGLRKSRPKLAEICGLLFVCLTLTCVSTWVWVAMCREYWPHADPDGYLFYSWALGDLFRMGDNDAFYDFWPTYPHLHLPLVPLLLCFPQMLGVDGHVLYLCQTALFSFGSILLLHAIVHRGYSKSSLISLAICLITLFHYRFALSFAKPSPDMVGVFLALTALAILVFRYQQARSWQLPAIAFTWFLLALARPQGITYIAPLGLLAVLVDALRTHTWHWKSLTLSFLKAGSCFAVALLILGGLYAAFDWDESFERGVEANQRYWMESAPLYQFWAAAKILQFFPLLALLGIRKTGWHPAYLIPLVWVVFHLILFPAAGVPVKSTRLYLPVVPMTVLSLLPWCWGNRNWRLALIALGVLFLAVNGFFITHLFFEDGLRSLWEQSWIR